MKTRICAALVVITVVTSAGAQLVSSHAPTAATNQTASHNTPPAMTRTAANGTSAKMAPPMEITDKVVARVNGAELTDRDLAREMVTLFPYSQQHNGFPKDLEPEIRRGALQMIIFEELAYQEAKRRNITIPPAKLTAAETAFRKQFPSAQAYKQFVQSETNGSEAAMKEKVRRSLLIENLINQEVNTPGHITTAQAKAQYEKNLAQYKHGEIVQIQSISIMPPDQTKAVQQEARKRADEALKQAKEAKNYRDFGLLAERVSDDDFHVKMGDHKPMEISKLPPPVTQALAKMKPGEVSDLIQFDNNYTIIRLETRTPAGVTPFTEVKSQLQSDMQKEKTEQLRSQLAQKLGQNAKIEKL
jgi:parvulin-like peptidyl-prolyl isomerase